MVNQVKHTQNTSWHQLCSSIVLHCTAVSKFKSSLGEQIYHCHNSKAVWLKKLIILSLRDLHLGRSWGFWLNQLTHLAREHWPHFERVVVWAADNSLTTELQTGNDVVIMSLQYLQAQRTQIKMGLGKVCTQLLNSISLKMLDTEECAF